MPARDDILRSIRRNLPQSMPLPEHTGPWIRYADPVAQFASVLAGVGGECVQVRSVSEIPPLLGEAAGPGKIVASMVPGIASAGIDLAAITDPHDLERVDLAVLGGDVAVAENAAVWVHDRNLRHRVLFFVCQHLALVVPRSGVVHHLHEAYERITPDATPFGCFLSGPSKTADIEQSLVKGAHGSRTLKVFLVGG